MASSSTELSSTLPQEIKSLLQPSPLSTSLILTTTPLPQPVHASDHLIKVHTTCPCAGELLWARDYPGLLPADKVPVPSQDLCGQVITAPPNSRFQPGEEVYARVSTFPSVLASSQPRSPKKTLTSPQLRRPRNTLTHPHQIPATRPGAAREYTLARESELSLKPRSLNFIEAAAVPLSALTAWQALFVHGTLDAGALKGDDEGARERNRGIRVLVTAATGGVGSWVVQLAAAAGAGAVVALCGRGKGALAGELGAGEVVDYTEMSLRGWVEKDQVGRECDLVVDCIGGDTLAQCWDVVRDGGTFLSIVGDPNSGKPKEGKHAEKKLAKATWFLVEPLGRNLDDVSGLIDAGKVRPLVDSVWEFEEYEKAFSKIEEGHARGKVVIKIDGLV